MTDGPQSPSWTIEELVARGKQAQAEDADGAAAAPAPVNFRTGDEMRDQAAAAHDVAQRIIANVRVQRTIWIRLAEDLFRFNELEMWRDLGYSSFESWLAEPDIDLSRRTVYYLLDVWRELVINKGVKPAELEKVGPGKVQEILPAVRRGQVSAEEALADVGTLTRGDLRERYRAPAPGTIPSGPDTGTALEATSEPEYAVCPSCGSRYRVKS